MNRNIIVLAAMGMAVILVEVFANIKDVYFGGAAEETPVWASVLDILLIIIGIAIIYYGRVFGGVLGAGMKWMYGGFVALAFAHASETILFAWRFIDADTGEILHRLIVFAGFVLILIGFRQTARALEKPMP